MSRIKRNLKPRKEEIDNDAADDDGYGAGADEADEPVVETFATVEQKGKKKSLKLSKAAAAAEADAKIKAQAASTNQRKIIELGKPRKGLSKKAKALIEEWSDVNQHGKKIDEMIQGHMDQARKKFGTSGVFHGSDTKRLVVGIPCPAFPFEFVTAQDAFLLGIIYHLVAKAKSGKSALLAEFIRWFYMAGGFGSVNENETKFSPGWYESIIGTKWFRKMPLHRCKSVEDWQNRLTFDIDSASSYKKAMEGTKEHPGPGRTLPIVFGVDSIMGKMSQDSQDAISRDGHAGRGFPVEALKIGRYLATMPQWLDGWPFAVVLVNHLKLSANPDTGQEERNLSGGKRTLFQESFELELRRGPKIECQEFEGYYVDINCAEQSFGPSGRRIKTRVIWWEEPDETGETDFKQKTVWDWDWSTVHLLHSIIKGDEKGGSRNVRFRKHLKDVDFHMEFESPTALTATAWSKTLGVSKDDALLWQDMGAMIRQNPLVMRLLRNALRIQRRPLLKGNYLTQMNKLAEEMP